MTPEGRQQVETLRAKIARFTDQPYVTAKKGDACALLSDTLKVLALLLAEAHPQDQEKKEDTDTRVEDLQYHPPSARPLATAASIEAIRAEAIARAAHFGQVEESTGDDYMRHIERVVALVEGDEAKAVAWLHDVWEDTPITGPAMAAAGISEHVVDAVRLLTRVPGEPYTRYILFIKHATNPLAAIVKLADLRDHLRPNCPERLRPRYEAALTVLADGGNQPPSGLRGDPGVPRTVNDEARDTESSSSSLPAPVTPTEDQT